MGPTQAASPRNRLRPASDPAVLSTAAPISASRLPAMDSEKERCCRHAPPND